MTEENLRQTIAEIPLSEAIELVGSKPSGSERKDLITYWGFGKKTWRWCIDTKMTLDEAIKTHQTIGDEIKMVVGKKGSIEKTLENDEKKKRAEMSKEEKQHEKDEKEREKKKKGEEGRRLKEEKREEKEKKKGKKEEKSSENPTMEVARP
jgi:hypothetical protein